jgi:ATP-binding cassette, subfamily B, bacterial
LEGADPQRFGLWSLCKRLRLSVQPTVDVFRRAAPRAAIIVIGSQLLMGMATAWTLLLTAEVLQQLFSEGPSPERLLATLPTLILLIVAQAIRLAMEAATAMASAYMLPRVHRVAEEELLTVSVQVDLASFDDPSFYDQLHRARDRGVMHMQGATTSLVTALSALFEVAGAAIALLWLHPLLLPLLIIALLPEGWSALHAARLQYAGMATTVALTRQSQMLAELATGRESAPEIRANQAQGYILSEYRRFATELQDHLVAVAMSAAKFVSLGRLLSSLGLLCAFVALGFMVHAQWLGLAVAGTAVIAMRSAGASLARLMQMLHELFEKGLYISDYREFIDRSRLRTRPTTGVEAPIKPGKIECRDIAFSYPGSNGRMALQGISLTIEAGQTIALVGENGSGKTTLAKLIAGLYRPTLGRIAWDGIDLGELSSESLADRVVMVLQDPIRWPRNAGDNIRLGRYQRVDPDLHALLDAARQSRALEVIEQLRNGWQTLLSSEYHGGQDLSGGQWQRLAVARGLYRDAPLVIWDEPTAPLDAKAEHAVYESLRHLAKDRTVILITHRLASVRNADRIYFLDRGSLAEHGTHNELLALNGKYAELFRLQSKLQGLGASDD